MEVELFLRELLNSREYRGQAAAVRCLPAREAVYDQPQQPLAPRAGRSPRKDGNQTALFPPGTGHRFDQGWAKRSNRYFNGQRQDIML